MAEVVSLQLYASQTKFRTVGLLVKLFKWMWGKSNEASMQLLCGHGSTSTFTYTSMRLFEAREAIALRRTAETSTSEGEGIAKGNSVQQTSDCNTPLYMIDNVPSLDTTHPEGGLEYQKCILLRNMIRCMHCVCLLSGTNTDTMGTIDHMSVGARGDSSREFLRLITRLPPINWGILECDVQYARVAAAVGDDVRAMLQRTRPLFAQHVLEAMLSLDPHQQLCADAPNCDCIDPPSSMCSDETQATASTTFGQLTSKVLSVAKQKILKHNTRFSSSKELLAQTMLAQSRFHAHSVYTNTQEEEEEEAENESNGRTPKRQRKRIYEERPCCVQHLHYGELRPANSGISLDGPLSLFVRPDENYMSVEVPQNVKQYSTGHTMLTRVLFNVEYAKPCHDALLYLICLRDGMVYNDQKVSSSFALRTLYTSKDKGDDRFGNNAFASAYSGRFLETEVTTAAVVASHSYGKGLSGCPLSFFLRALVAEMNIDDVYVPESDFALTVPPHYENLFVGLLPAVDTSWQQQQAEGAPSEGEEEDEGEGCRWLQNGSILLTDVDWRANRKESDSIISAMMTDNVYCTPLEINCVAGTTGTCTGSCSGFSSGSGVVEKERNDHLITIIVVVNKGAEITSDNKTFNATKQNHHVVRIRGNASPTQTVGNVLAWESVHEHNVSAPCGTVVQVRLDTIYWGRCDLMKNIYRSM